jgi:nucleoside-diphosphate-sugar epimerase
MFPRRVLITGAAGFIGSRLCEVLHLLQACEVRAFIHSTGSAARVARLPLDFIVGDLCDSKAVQRATADCDAVVHLARGSARVMRAGLDNVLRSAVEHRISRFVHMSSVAVYGNNPPAESVTEDAIARRTDLAYGNEKLAQENRIRRYAQKQSLPAVILRPPNVYGPFSPFTTGVMNKIGSGAVAIVDGGNNPCNLVYVENLVEAIMLALWKPQAVGQTFFVTDRDVVTWKRCLDDYAEMQGKCLPHISAAQLVPIERTYIFRDSLRKLPAVFFSGDFRRPLQRIPLFERVERFLYERFELLPLVTQQSIRLWLQGPERISARALRRFSASDNIMAAQTRKVAHSSEKARALLGYSAAVSYEEGLALTKEWLRFSRLIH